MDGDLNRVKAVSDGHGFVHMLDELVAAELTNDFWSITLPAELDSSSARNPQLFAYRAAQNRLNAPVLFSHKKIADLIDPTVHSKKKSLDRHHLFPRAWLKRKGIADLKLVNQMANQALVEWPDDILISDGAPQVYVPKLRDRFTDEVWDAMYDLHALPDAWQEMEYTTFLNERRKRMADVIRRGFQTLS